VIKTGKQNKNLRSRRKNNLLLDTAPFQVKEAYKSARTNMIIKNTLIRSIDIWTRTINRTLNLWNLLFIN